MPECRKVPGPAGAPRIALKLLMGELAGAVIRMPGFAVPGVEPAANVVVHTLTVSDAKAAWMARSTSSSKVDAGKKIAVCSNVSAGRGRAISSSSLGRDTAS